MIVRWDRASEVKRILENLGDGFETRGERPDGTLKPIPKHSNVVGNTNL